MNTARRHRRQERKRRITLAVLLLMVLALILSMLTSAPADAHGEEMVGDVEPADRAILVTTPGYIHVRVAGDGPVDIRLTDAAGNVIAFTGEPVREDGLVTLRPPTLESGTYLLVWDDDGERISSFSIGRETATVDADDARGGAGLPAAALAAILHIGAFLLGLLAAKGPRSRLAPLLVGAGLCVIAGAFSFGLPGDLGSGLVAVALLVSGSAAVLTGVGRGRPGLTGWGLLTGAAALALVTLGVAVWRNGIGDIASLEGALAVLGVTVTATVALPLAAMGAARAAQAGAQAVSRPAGVAVAAVIAALLTAVPALASGRAAEVELARAETESLEECLANPNRLQAEHCMEAAITVVAEESGINSALERLEGLVTGDPKARYYCHETSHAIGRASLRINGNLGDAFRDGYDVCDFGYYHGIVEAAASGLDDAGFRDLAATVCSDFASAEELFFMQCTHGLGHAAARRTNNDMIRSLEFCDALRSVDGLEGGRLRQALNGCGTGVTMEWFATAQASDTAAVLPAVEAPREVCNLVSEDWAESCFEYVGNTVDSSNPLVSLGEISAWCETTAHPEACYRGVARAGGGLGIGDTSMIAICDAANTAQNRNACVRYYIITVATTIDYSVDAVDRVCQALPPADQTGPLSLCQTVREVVAEVLAGGDGKDRSSSL